MHQDCHGALPTVLYEFLVDDVSWDARLCAWLLFLIKEYSQHHEGIWPQYIKSLPGPSDLHLLLAFSPMEQMLLKVPQYVLGLRLL